MNDVHQIILSSGEEYNNQKLDYTGFRYLKVGIPNKRLCTGKSACTS